MNDTSKTILFLVVIALVAVIGYLVLNQPDTRNPIQKVGDAVEQLPNGADNAARELKDRTPGERLKDDIKDATDGK